ncbi:hypothetical protein AGMMS49546_18100 [Spirochaetia bacterium]|nr:hypothetical protein AGMMS49546_18100 [Spirochaetia bacterium]
MDGRIKKVIRSLTGNGSIKRTFFVFSILFFLIIFAGGTIAFVFTMYRNSSEAVENKLSLTLETLKIRLANKIDGELTLVLKLADTPCIKRYLLDPDNPDLIGPAFEEFAAHRRNSVINTVFWVSDRNRKFYLDDAVSYTINPEDPKEYWYNMTLYETEKYNVNINYNADMDITNLWINAPVFENGKPVGIVGSAIGLSDFNSYLYEALRDDMDIYFFNALDEITVAEDQSLTFNKVLITEHLGALGAEIAAIAKQWEITPGATDTRIYTKDRIKYAISPIPNMGWYIIGIHPFTASVIFKDIMTGFFAVVILLVIIIFIVCNVFITRMKDTVDNQNRLLIVVNEVTLLLLGSHEEKFQESIERGIEMLARCADVDLIYIWKNVWKDGELYYRRMYRWMENDGLIKDPQNESKDFSFSAIPEWGKQVKAGLCVNGPLSDVPSDVRGILAPFGIRSMLDIPLFIEDQFWGLISFDDTRKERTFTEDEINILRSGGLLMVNAISRNEMTENLVLARKEALASAGAKSAFLANMSHEIRTPMNAILGMTELILREDLPKEVQENAVEIKNAGANLLSLINDILDFSKIESGKMDIVPVEYLFSSLINDAISIIRMRFVEKPLLFITNIDNTLPNKLEGDVLRIRQVLLNLLSNAVKYTREGQVTLTAAAVQSPGEEQDGGRIMISFKVSDTGIGIKKEDMGKLFGEFNQFDAKKNQGIEGTGLGLAISRQLCRLMGGDITVESRYGQGSDFTALIPQRVLDPAPFAVVERPEKKRVLIFENRRLVADSLGYSLNALSVPYRIAADREDFFRELEGGTFEFAFIPAGIADTILALIKEKNLATCPVLLAGLGEFAAIQNIPIISMPAFALSLANVLNGVQSHNYQQKASVRFTAPDAKILIVDDIVTNLNVARGLLALYQTDITTVTGGEEAIELVRNNSYDMILMDHMMPKMDGIEATAAIRAWEDAQSHSPAESAKRIPIIALTANAISGMKEMFLEKGFDDYLSKPIEIPKLDEMMAKWIPAEKQLKTMGETPPERIIETTDISIAGVDTARGLAMTGGAEAGYRKVLAAFSKDAKERFVLLDHLPGEQELSLFTTGVHALKSAAASIGAAAVSEQAAELEKAGKAGEIKTIAEQLEVFYRDLKNLVEQIDLAMEGAAGGAEVSAESAAASLSLFTALASALEQEDIGKIRRILAELEQKPFDGKTKEIIGGVFDAVLMTEFEEALRIVKNLLNDISAEQRP